MVLSVILSTENVSEVFVERVDPDGFLGQEGSIVNIELVTSSLSIAVIGPGSRFRGTAAVRQRFPAGRDERHSGAPSRRRAVARPY